MPYFKQAVADYKEIFWYTQKFLRAANGGNWSFIDGCMGGGPPPPPGGAWTVEADWDNDANIAALADDDFIVLQASIPGGADNGVVRFGISGGQVTWFRGHTAGWDSGTHTGKAGDVVLGDAGAIPGFADFADDAGVVEIRVFVNTRRAIIACMDVNPAMLYFAYIGLIQTNYDAATDPNPLIACADATWPGENPDPVAEMLLQDGVNPGAVLFNDKTFPLAAGGTLGGCQPNERSPAPSRTGIPVLCCFDNVNNEEVRGELEGVFFYGAAGGLTVDTPVTRSDGTYLTIGASLVLGPIN